MNPNSSAQGQLGLSQVEANLFAGGCVSQAERGGTPLSHRQKLPGEVANRLRSKRVCGLCGTSGIENIGSYPPTIHKTGRLTTRWIMIYQKINLR